MEKTCPRCGSEADVTGRACLDGHPLASGSPLDDLRAQVEGAFEEASVSLQAAIWTEASGQEAPAERQVPPPPPPPMKPPKRFVPPPPPPPPAPEDRAEARSIEDPHVTGVWARLANEIEQHPELDPSDPITAFSPAPRIDWGPEKGSLARRALRRDSAAPRLASDATA